MFKRFVNSVFNVPWNSSDESSLTPDHLSSSRDGTTSGNDSTTNAPLYGNDPTSDAPSYSNDPFTDAPSSHEGTDDNNQSITSESGNEDHDTRKRRMITQQSISK